MARGLVGASIWYSRCLKLAPLTRRYSMSAKLDKSQLQSSFLEDFIQSHRPPQQSVDYFSPINWTRRVLENNAYETIPFWSRYLVDSTGENRFFSSIVNTEVTLPHLLSMRAKDIKTPDMNEQASRMEADSASSKLNMAPEVLCLISLGPGLEAHPSIVHGGFQCVIFDEVMRLLVLVHHNNLRMPGLRVQHFTLEMKTSYLAPVITPSDVLVRSQLIKREGRKWVARADIVDATGMTLTTAESVWITKKI